jgi:phage shock protein PspC (stress-responsive transcriptional regulator)
MAKRLYRSSKSKVLGGVCGGLGEYFDIDPTLIRLFAVLALFFSDGAVFVAYIVAWIIMPLNETSVATSEERTQKTPASPASEIPNDPTWHSFLPGVILIALGALLLVREYFYWYDWGDFWPVLLIVLGLALIVFKGTNRGRADVPSSYGANGHTTNGQNGGHQS